MYKRTLSWRTGYYSSSSDFSEIRVVCLIFNFLVSVLLTIVCLVILFQLAIVWYVPLKLMDSDYTLDISNNFLQCKVKVTNILIAISELNCISEHQSSSMYLPGLVMLDLSFLCSVL